jgi:hypothetical protein
VLIGSIVNPNFISDIVSACARKLFIFMCRQPLSNAAPRSCALCRFTELRVWVGRQCPYIPPLLAACDSGVWDSGLDAVRVARGPMAGGVEHREGCKYNQGELRAESDRYEPLRSAQAALRH